MFKRLVFENWVMLFPIVALITASTIFGTITWRALRMKSEKTDDLANLPFNDQTHS